MAQSRLKSLLMTEFILIVLLSCSFARSMAQDTSTWSRIYSNGRGSEYIYEGILTAEGDFVLFGTTDSHSSLGNEYNFFLVKANSTGEMLWKHIYGDEDWEYARSLVQTVDGGFALVGTIQDPWATSDIILIKTDSEGQTEWNRTYGQYNDDRACNIILTADGGFAIIGYTEAVTSLDPVYGYWIIKTDTTGTIQWSQSYDVRDPFDEEEFRLSGAYTSTGIQTSDGGFLIAGTVPLSAMTNTSDLWLVKTDANGTAQWNQTIGGMEQAGLDPTNTLIQTVDGGYVLAGSIRHLDFWLIKLDVNGNIQWNQTYGTSKWDIARAVTQTLDNGYLIAGQTGVTAEEGFSDAWLVKTDANGVIQWNRTYGEKNTSDSFSDVIQLTDGTLILMGSTSSYSADGSDFWLIKTDANGTPPPPPPSIEDYSSFDLILIVRCLIIGGLIGASITVLALSIWHARKK